MRQMTKTPILPIHREWIQPADDHHDNVLHDSDACTVTRCCVEIPAEGRQHAAFKRIKISNFAAFSRFERERDCLSSFVHPNIVKPLGILEMAPEYGLLLPLSSHGSLSELLHSGGSRPIGSVLAIAFSHDMCSALEYLHDSVSFFHRDVKPANAVLMDTGHVQLIDFDRSCHMSTRVEEERRKGPSGGWHKDYMVGTLVYMAPELLRRRPFEKASDVYSMTITINELATGCIPYSDVRTTTEQLHTVLEANYTEITLTAAIVGEALRPKMPGDEDGPWVPAFRDIVRAGWEDDAMQRPGIASLRKQLEELGRAAGFDPTDMTERMKRIAELGPFHGRNEVEKEPSMSASAKEVLRERSPYIPHYDENVTVHLVPQLPPSSFVWGGGSSSCGRRGQDKMEDAHCIHQSICMDEGKWTLHLFGVFDGHGGPEAASYCKKAFPYEVVAAMRERPTELEAAMIAAFQRVETSFLSWAQAADNDSGCTAMVVVISQRPADENGTGALDMLVANAGDCRAVLARGDKVVQLSRDHNASNEDEARRIRSEGGTVVETADKKKRVDGRIEVTRSIGDRRWKSRGVTCIPEVDVYSITSEDKFLVLATDGVWGCMTNEDTVEKVAQTVKHVDFGPKRLISEAYEAGSDDNITALVVYLKKPE